MPKKPYQEGSILDFSVKAFSMIKKLSESSLISEKLISFNSLLFVLILGLDISFWLNGGKEISFGYIVILAISMLFSLILSLLYLHLLQILSNFSEKKVDSLRISLSIQIGRAHV